MKENGYTIRVFNLVNMEYSDSWNALAEIEDLDDSQSCADTIILNTQLHSKTDDFWPRAEENLLKALILYYMREDGMVEEQTLTKIYKTVANGDIKLINDMFSKIDDESAAKLSYNIFSSGSDTIKASVITGLGTRLQAFQNKMVQKLTNTSDIDLELPAKQKCAYFLILSDMENTYSFLSSLFFTFFFKKLCKYADSRPNGVCDVPVRFLLDEFCNIGKIPDFNKKISTVRSRGIDISMVIQNIPQLTGLYIKDSWQELIGNCDTRICLRLYGHNDSSIYQ